MNEQLIKELISYKLKMSDHLMDIAPPKVREKLKPIHSCIIKALHESTSQYIADTRTNGQKTGDSGVKNISID